jgi:glyoxylase-like metal-dependent hydrolase (beta-lactamase superfamily II)
MKWLIGFAVVLAALAGLAWYFVFDGATPARAEGVFDIAAYRALVAADAPQTLPSAVRVEFIGESEAPSFAAEAGAFDGQRTFAYPAFQVVAPHGATIIDASVDAETLEAMSDGKGRFDRAGYERLLAALGDASQILVTHEHLDHVIAIARHPAPETIAPRLRLTALQLAALPQHAPGGQIAPAIANAAPLALDGPTRLAPGIVAAPAPGHSPGTIVIFVRTSSREYLFIGDIAWQMSSLRNARGRPRLIGLIIPGVDPDRPAVLAQVRALHDLMAAEPDLAIVPAHDAAYLRERLAEGAFTEGFAGAAP